MALSLDEGLKPVPASAGADPGHDRLLAGLAASIEIRGYRATERHFGQNRENPLALKGKASLTLCVFGSSCRAEPSYAASVMDSTTECGIPVAEAIASTCARVNQLIHSGRVVAGSSMIRAIAPTVTSIYRAVASSQESMASPGTGSTRTGNRPFTIDSSHRVAAARPLPAQTNRAERRSAHSVLNS
jgi:hypothetical protein